MVVETGLQFGSGGDGYSRLYGMARAYRMLGLRSQVAAAATSAPARSSATSSSAACASRRRTPPRRRSFSMWTWDGCSRARRCASPAMSCTSAQARGSRFGSCGRRALCSTWREGRMGCGSILGVGGRSERCVSRSPTTAISLTALEHAQKMTLTLPEHVRMTDRTKCMTHDHPQGSAPFKV